MSLIQFGPRDIFLFSTYYRSDLAWLQVRVCWLFQENPQSEVSTSVIKHLTWQATSLMEDAISVWKHCIVDWSPFPAFLFRFLIIKWHFSLREACMLLRPPFPGKWPLLGLETVTIFRLPGEDPPERDFASRVVTEERWCTYVSDTTRALRRSDPWSNCSEWQPRSEGPSVLETRAEKLQTHKPGTGSGCRSRWLGRETVSFPTENLKTLETT